MRRLTTTAACLALLLGCAPSYHLEPFIGLTYRDEEFNGRGTIQDTYTGETWMIGTRLVHRPPLVVHLPTRLPSLGPTPVEQELRAELKTAREDLIRAREEVKTEHAVGHAQDEADVGWIERSINAIAKSEWTWPGVGALAVLAGIVWMLRRRRKKNGTPK